MMRIDELEEMGIDSDEIEDAYREERDGDN